MLPYKSPQRTKERIPLPKEEVSFQTTFPLPKRSWTLSIFLGLLAGTIAFFVLFALFVLCFPAILEFLEPLPQLFYRDETYFTFSVILAGILSIYATFGFRRRWRKA